MKGEFFHRRPDWISGLLVTFHFGVVLAPVFVAAALPIGWHLLLCWLLFGLFMHGLLNVLHECAHYLVFRRKLGSVILGKYILAPLVFADFEAFRWRHWQHHKHLGVDGETKLTYQHDISGWKCLALLLRCLFVMEAAKKFLKQDSGDQKQGHQKDRYWLLRAALLQGLLLGGLMLTSYLTGSGSLWQAAFHGLVVYAMVYMYGLMSLVVFMAHLRGVAEHRIGGDTGATCGFAALRNFRPGPISRLLFGTYGFCEHYTHHHAPGIPYYHLSAATSQLAQDDVSFRPARSYFGILRDLICSKPPAKPVNQIHQKAA